MSARVFSRLLATARQVRMDVGGEIHMGMMGLRYAGADISQFGALGADVRPRVFAPGFLKIARETWVDHESRYLGDIPLGPCPAGGCSVVAMVLPGKPDRELLGHFRTFSKLGGSHLPDKVLQSHEIWPDDPVDRWLTFLWRVGVLDGAHDMVLLSGNAFDASARAIERCGLHIGSSTFPQSPDEQDAAGRGKRKRLKRQENGGKPKKQRGPEHSELAGGGDTEETREDEETAESLVGKGGAPRDEWMVGQYEASGTDTYHKPAKVHLKWDTMRTAERAEICPDAPNKITKAAVEQAIKRFIKKRDSQE